MNSKYNNRQRGVDHHCYQCERKQRISIKDQGDLLIKNTKTQTLELYRCNINKQDLQDSSSNTDDQIQETMLQLADLDKHIEQKIVKLMNFRYELERKNTKRKQATVQATNKHLTWSQNLSKKHGPFSSDVSPDRARRHQDLNWPQNRTKEDGANSIDKSRQGLKSGSYEANSNFSTTGIAPLSQRSTVEEEPRVAKTLPDVKDVACQVPYQPAEQDETNRITGGSAYGHCDDMCMPHSVYQLDYPPTNEPYCPQIGHCQRGNRPFSYYDKPITCAPNTCCYQYPVEPVYHYMSHNEFPMPSCEKRITDLNTEQFCRGCPLAVLSRASSPRQQKSPTEKSKPKYPTSYQKSQNQHTATKISVRKQEADKTDAQRWAKPKIKKDKMINKAYVAARKPPTDYDHKDRDTKLRLHREYLNMYKQEEQKTARKVSSQNTSVIEANPTYTKLPTIKEEQTEEKPYSALQESVDTKAAPLSDSHQEMGVEKRSVTQITMLYKARHDRQVKLQTRNLSITCNKIDESASNCQANEVVQELFVQSPVPNDMNIRVEHSLREYCRQLPATDNQSGQTSSHQSITPAPFVSDRNSPVGTTRTQHITTGSLQVTSENVQHDQYTKLDRGNTVPQFSQQHDLALSSVQQTSADQGASQEPEWLKRKPDEYRSYVQQKSAHTYNKLSELQHNASSMPDCQEVMQSLPQADIPVVSFKYPRMPGSPVNKACSSSGSHFARIDNRCQVVESTDEIYDGKSPCELQTVFKSQINSCREYPEVERGQNYNYNTELRNNQIDCDNLMESQSKICSQVLNPLSVSDQTKQKTTNLELCTELQNSIDRSTKQQPFTYTYESQWKQRIERKKLAINSQQTPIQSTVCAKCTHSVTFKDEIGFSKRNNAVTCLVDWEQVTEVDSDLRVDSAQVGTLPQQIAEDDALTESYLSSSLADITCNESKIEEDFLTCNESQTEREDNQIPPFSCCPCMYEDYLKLAAQG